jgi:esterase/lipase
MDPAIDPSERPCPGCYRGHPAQANRMPGIGRANTLKTWLSMWSLTASKCQGREHLTKFTAPALVVQSKADMGVFPSDARKIFDYIGSKDKTLEMVPGAHYFEDSVPHRESAVELMVAWINAKI